MKVFYSPCCIFYLFFQVMFSESLNWSSSLSATDIKIGQTVKNVAGMMFVRMERNFGDALVRRALGYLMKNESAKTRWKTCSRWTTPSWTKSPQISLPPYPNVAYPACIG